MWLGHSDIKNLIKKVSIAWKHYGLILQSDVFHINKLSRRFIEKTSRKQEQIHWDLCSTYMDNHADTYFFVRNIQPISYTSEECMVAPFLGEYSGQLIILICTGATSYTMESGEFIIIIFGQGVWFGNRM